MGFEDSKIKEQYERIHQERQFICQSNNLIWFCLNRCVYFNKINFNWGQQSDIVGNKHSP
jgi:hypothetical protein